jgi:hypothetical protein
MGVTIGLPAETKDRERRVALTPSAVHTAVDRGHRVLVQAGAGEGAGFSDDDYEAAGAKLVADAAEVWGADVVVKVKEPQRAEYGHFRDDLTLFAYLHLAAEPDLTDALVAPGPRLRLRDADRPARAAAARADVGDRRPRRGDRRRGPAVGGRRRLRDADGRRRRRAHRPRSS